MPGGRQTGVFEPSLMRFRASLFIAQVDPEKLHVIRSTVRVSWTSDLRVII